MGDTPQVDVKIDATEDTRFLSRKFILTVAVLLMVGILPMVYKSNGVSETVTMTVLALLGAVGVAYGFVNVKDAKIEAEKTLAKVLGAKAETHE